MTTLRLKMRYDKTTNKNNKTHAEGNFHVTAESGVYLPRSSSPWDASICFGFCSGLCGLTLLNLAPEGIHKARYPSNAPSQISNGCIFSRGSDFGLHGGRGQCLEMILVASWGGGSMLIGVWSVEAGFATTHRTEHRAASATKKPSSLTCQYC